MPVIALDTLTPVGTQVFLETMTIINKGIKCMYIVKV